MLVLTLAGCSSTTGPAPAETPATTAAAAPVAAVKSAADIEDLETGAAYALSLDASTPNLSSEISATTIKLGELIGADQSIPFDVHNDIGSDLIKVNSDVLSDPTNAATYLPDLHAVAGVIKGAI